MISSMKIPLLVLGLAFTAAACHRGVVVGSPAAGTSAVVRSASGDSLGTLELHSTPQGFHIAGSLRGLTPGTHGIHLHTVGRCDAPGFTTAGAHFNPMARQHGLENAAGPHAGDLANITANSSGDATVDLSSSLTTVPAMLDADGTAIVVHAAADDYHTDPSGNSGARVACGVLR